MQNTNPLFAHKETLGKSFCQGLVFPFVGKDWVTLQGRREYFVGRMQTEDSGLWTSVQGGLFAVVREFQLPKGGFRLRKCRKAEDVIDSVGKKLIYLLPLYLNKRYPQKTCDSPGDES